MYSVQVKKQFVHENKTDFQQKFAPQIMSYFNEVDIGQPDFVDIESSLTWNQY